ncbi:MAG: hypothetical protein JWM86_2665 [Thermoleophilia bacterium]|nr:hypothetical protein [Thermoleophilia bacterium]
MTPPMLAAHRAPLAWLQPYVVVLTAWGCSLGLLVVIGGVVHGAKAGAGAPGRSASVPPAHAAHAVDAAAGERELPVRFGSIVVAPPTFVRGTTAKALAGSTHGINGYVPPDHQLVQVPVRLRNHLRRQVRFDPRWFRLVGAKVMPAVSSTLVPGDLLPGSSIEGAVAFLAPRDGRPLQLVFHEPGHPAQRLPLGSSGAKYQPAPGDVSQHHAAH